MKVNLKLIFSTLLLFFGFALAFLGLRNLKSVENSYFKLSRKNTNLLQELDRDKNNYKLINQDLNNKKTRIEKLENELDKFNIISNKTNEIENLHLKIQESIVEYEKNLFDDYFLAHDKLNEEKPLNGIFINSNLDENSIKSNLSMLAYLINSPINYELNKKIGVHNSKVYESLGIIKYLEKGDNYLIKSLLLNDSSEVSSLLEEKNKVDSLIADYFSIYKNIYRLSNLSSNFVDNKGLEFTKNENNNFNNLNAFAIEILNSSLNYLKDFRVEKKSGERNLFSLDYKLMTENSKDKKIITTYYNNIDEYNYNFVDEID